MDSNGDMYNGSTIVNETDVPLTAGSAVQVNLGFQASGKCQVDGMAYAPEGGG